METATRICVGQFVGSHGVRGRVKVKSYTAVPESLFAYGQLTDESGARAFALTMTGMGKDHFLAELQGVRDRDAADALKGTRLYINRDQLPATDDEDEFYHADLIGLVATTADGEPFGEIKAIYDFGGGDMLEIAHAASGKMVSLPFTRAAVPVVDVKAGIVTVEPPAGLFEKVKPTPEELAEMEGGPAADEAAAAGCEEAIATEEDAPEAHAGHGDERA
ncbi:16S rRNA processing protein RimM [Nitrospirillum amazonense]|uniref:Ribosome maturation factor RimM n=1 Tax=Nitrospirillum amazonense TaxID=28077 RepID=A0A560FIH8_9PROT|nr:ribosome maturation factor RimM [Nitrospirillum amazonense]TWB21413.1 16S rRNA processing protein RimM [Nitrospirillum amazonense]